MGASVDLVSEDLRRMIINAAYFLTGRKVPENADVAYVDPFIPHFMDLYGIRNTGPLLTCNQKIMVWVRPPVLRNQKALRNGTKGLS